MLKDEAVPGSTLRLRAEVTRAIRAVLAECGPYRRPSEEKAAWAAGLIYALTLVDETEGAP